MSHHLKGASKKKSETRMPPEEDPEFQIAPMIDILLVLLVFFMSISSTEVLQTNDQVRLPTAKDAKEKSSTQGDGQLILNVLWNSVSGSGSIDIDKRAFMTAPEIVPMLQDKLQRTPEFRLLIRADKDVRYEYLRTILSAAGGAGVKNVTFSVVNKDAAPEAAAP